MAWQEQVGVVQVINHYEETRNSPPRLQLFEDRFAAYRVEAGMFWLRAADGAVVGYPLDRINQVALGDDREGGPADGHDPAGGDASAVAPRG